jgi:flagellar operon protein
MQGIDGVNLPFMPIGGVRELNKSSVPTEISKSQSSFKDIFAKELESIKFSAHAQSRINSRDIDLSTQDMQRLESAVDKAREKGANESLVLMDDKAFIVSVPNSTVITVMDKNNLNSNVVTGIDSAVFA